MHYMVVFLNCVQNAHHTFIHREWTDTLKTLIYKILKVHFLYLKQKCFKNCSSVHNLEPLTVIINENDEKLGINLYYFSSAQKRYFSYC